MTESKPMTLNDRIDISNKEARELVVAIVADLAEKLEAAESEIRELREKLEYTENKLGTMLAIDEMLYLRGFSKPTDWSVSYARWKVIVKLQSLAREALGRILGEK